MQICTNAAEQILEFDIPVVKLDHRLLVFRDDNKPASEYICFRLLNLWSRLTLSFVTPPLRFFLAIRNKINLFYMSFKILKKNLLFLL